MVPGIDLAGTVVSSTSADWRAGERVMASITRFLTERLRLKVNIAKSAVDRPWVRTFLGYTMTAHKQPRLRVAAKSVKRLRSKLRMTLRQGRGRTLATTVRTLTPILRGWLQPMLHPSAFTDGGRALVVLDEIGAHGEGEIRAHVLREMEGFARKLHALLAPHLPHLDDDELRARLRFVSGAVLGPPPRSHGAPRFASGKGADDIEYLLRFATAALTG